jgi:hypothetical protein
MKITRRSVLALIGLAPAAALISFKSSEGAPPSEAYAAGKLVDAGVPVDHATMAFNRDYIKGPGSVLVAAYERHDCTFELVLNNATAPLEVGDAFRATAGSIEMDYVVTSAIVSARNDEPIVVEYEGLEVTRGSMEVKAVLDVMRKKIHLDRKRLQAENVSLSRGRLPL